MTSPGHCLVLEVLASQDTASQTRHRSWLLGNPDSASIQPLQSPSKRRTQASQQAMTIRLLPHMASRATFHITNSNHLSKSADRRMSSGSEPLQSEPVTPSHNFSGPDPPRRPDWSITFSPASTDGKVSNPSMTGSIQRTLTWLLINALPLCQTVPENNDDEKMLIGNAIWNEPNVNEHPDDHRQSRIHRI
jgi:hypothetical protein